jgi:peptidyl-dipeptidase Dcp
MKMKIKPYFEIKTQVLETGVFYAANQYRVNHLKKRHDNPVYQRTFVYLKSLMQMGKSLALFLLRLMINAIINPVGAWMK